MFAIALGALAGLVWYIQPPPPTPVVDPLPLQFIARLPAGAALESSGIVRSRRHEDLLWSLNDSGNAPRLYALHRDGSPYLKTEEPQTPGVLIEGAKNVDWEDLATFADGTLIIADLGNNQNARQDLALYFVPEPDPTAARSAPARRFPVRFPDQASFPPPANALNFDCEAVFVADGQVYCLTKHRSDARTKLYRLDNPRENEINTLSLVDDFEIGGKVVAADYDESGRRLLVLTYRTVWLFEREAPGSSFFRGRISRRDFALPQSEAICFADGETAFMTDELADSLFAFRLSELRPAPAANLPPPAR